MGGAALRQRRAPRRARRQLPRGTRPDLGGAHRHRGRRKTYLCREVWRRSAATRPSGGRREVPRDGATRGRDAHVIKDGASFAGRRGAPRADGRGPPTRGRAIVGWSPPTTASSLQTWARPETGRRPGERARSSKTSSRRSCARQGRPPAHNLEPPALRGLMKRMPSTPSPRTRAGLTATAARASPTTPPPLPRVGEPPAPSRPAPARAPFRPARARRPGGFHIPTRRPVVASNMLLGHPDVKDDLVRCQDASRRSFATVRPTARPSTATPSARTSRRSRRDAGSVFGALGASASARDEQPPRQPAHLRADDENFTARFRALFEGDPSTGPTRSSGEHPRPTWRATTPKAARFTAVAVGQRQRLFFTLPKEQAAELGLWELTVFQHAGEYLDRALRPHCCGAAGRRRS